MEFIYKLRYKKNGLYIWRNPLEEYGLVLSDGADIYRTFEQIPQQIKLSCGTQLTRDDLEVVKFAVIPHEVVEFPKLALDDLNVSWYNADSVHPTTPFHDWIKSAEDIKNIWLAEQDKM